MAPFRDTGRGSVRLLTAVKLFLQAKDKKRPNHFNPSALTNKGHALCTLHLNLASLKK